MDQLVRDLVWIVEHPPTAVAAWVAFITSSVLATVSVVNAIRHRQRIRLEKITSHVNCEYWSQSEINQAIVLNGDSSGISPSDYPGSILIVHVGDCKRRFEVLEFTITNRYRHQITLGRINVGKWIRADQYRPGMYDRKRDYRVFDLLTRERINLEEFRTMEPGQVLGIRIESFEEENAGRPTFVSNHVYPAVEVPEYHIIRLSSDMGTRQYRVELNKPEVFPLHFRFEYRWSTDIDGLGEMVATPGAPMPQGMVVNEAPNSSRFARAQFQWRQRIASFGERVRGWM